MGRRVTPNAWQERARMTRAKFSENTGEGGWNGGEEEAFQETSERPRPSMAEVGSLNSVVEPENGFYLPFLSRS